MMKKMIFLIIILAAAAVHPAVAQNERSQRGNRLGLIIQNGEATDVLEKFSSLYFVCEDAGATAGSFTSGNEPPLLTAQSVWPEAPSTGKPVGITARIYNDPVLTQSKTLAAYLYFSTGGTDRWKMIEMERDPANGDFWHADLPPFEEPGPVRYFFTASDDEGNYYMEVPGTEVAWASEEDISFIGIIPDDNDLRGAAPDDLDILSASIGYDGEYAYFNMVVEGDISGGTMSPMAVNVYSVGIYPVDSGGNLAGAPSLVLEHAQLGRAIGFPVIGLLDPGKDLGNIEAAGAEYYSSRNHLHMRVKKDSLESGEDFMRVVFGAAEGIECAPLAFRSRDISAFINLRFVDRQFLVAD